MGGAWSRTRGGSAEAPQRRGSGARPRSLEGRLSGTGWNHHEWLERREDGFLGILHAIVVPLFQLCVRARLSAVEKRAESWLNIDLDRLRDAVTQPEPRFFADCFLVTLPRFLKPL